MEQNSQLLRNISEAVSRAVVDVFAANSSQPQTSVINASAGGSQTLSSGPPSDINSINDVANSAASRQSPAATSQQVTC